MAGWRSVSFMAWTFCVRLGSVTRVLRLTELPVTLSKAYQHAPGPFELPIPLRHILHFHVCEDMAADFLSHPGTRRVCAVSVPDSERELKPLKNSLKIHPLTPLQTPYKQRRFRYGGEGRNRTDE